MSNNRRVRAALFLTVASALSKPLGYARDAALAAVFGATGVADALFIAQSVPQVLFATISDALGTTFIPVYTARLTREGRQAADHSASAVLTLSLLLATLTAVLAYLFAPWVVYLVAPGFRGDQASLAVLLTRILLPTMLLYVLAAVSTAYLQAHERFTLPALTGFPYNLIVIAATLFLGTRYGAVPVAWALLAAVASQWLLLVPGLWRLGARLRPRLALHDPALRTLFTLVGPVVLSTGAGQLGFVVDRMLASTLPAGRIAALTYAQRLYGLPVGIFVSALVTVAYPMLAQRAAAGDLDGLRQGLARSLRLMLAALIPLAALLMVLRVPVIRLLFQHGSFTADDTDQTADALFFFALGLVPVGLLQLAQRVHFAMGDTFRPMLWGIAGVAVNVVADLLLVGPLAQGGLALGTALNLALNAVGLLFSIRTRLEHLDGRLLLTTALRAALAAGAAALVAGGVWGLLAPQAVGLLRLALALAAAGGLGLAVYAGAAWALRLDEMRQLGGSLWLRWRGRLAPD